MKSTQEAVPVSFWVFKDSGWRCPGEGHTVYIVTPPLHTSTGSLSITSCSPHWDLSGTKHDIGHGARSLFPPCVAQNHQIALL